MCDKYLLLMYEQEFLLHVKYFLTKKKYLIKAIDVSSEHHSISY